MDNINDVSAITPADVTFVQEDKNDFSEIKIEK